MIGAAAGRFKPARQGSPCMASLGLPQGILAVAHFAAGPKLRPCRRSGRRRERLVGAARRRLRLPMPPPNSTLAELLVDTFLAGTSLRVASIVARVDRLFGRRRAWVEAAARRFWAAFRGRTRPRRSEASAFLQADPSVRRALARITPDKVARWIPEPQRMQPVDAARDWPVPVIESSGALADWLGLTAGELEWFADLCGLGRRLPASSKLSHYFYRPLAKPGGGVRLIEAPKPRLKQLQHFILHGLLCRIPVHDAAHGFRRGRSIRSFGTPHVGRDVILRMDLENFFPSISGARVQALFRTAGYPERVADLLGGLLTNSTPRSAWGVPVGGAEEEAARLVAARRLHAHRHLPQGAPSSPAVANLCAYRLDCRLSGLAAAAGAVYTRYSDDLAFSGDEDFARQVERFAVHAAAIAVDEGFAVNHRKTRVMRPGVRQRLAGLVVNQKLNLPRDEYDRLKAILTNCARHGPEGQNRDGRPLFREHLGGRVAFAESVNPSRGARLREIFERIRWDS